MADDVAASNEDVCAFGGMVRETVREGYGIPFHTVSEAAICLREN